MDKEKHKLALNISALFIIGIICCSFFYSFGKIDKRLSQIEDKLEELDHRVLASTESTNALVYDIERLHESVDPLIGDAPETYDIEKESTEVEDKNSKIDESDPEVMAKIVANSVVARYDTDDCITEKLYKELYSQVIEGLEWTQHSEEFASRVIHSYIIDDDYHWEWYGDVVDYTFWHYGKDSNASEQNPHLIMDTSNDTIKGLSIGDHEHDETTFTTQDYGYYAVAINNQTTKEITYYPMGLESLVNIWNNPDLMDDSVTCRILTKYASQGEYEDHKYPDRIYGILLIYNYKE